MSRSKFPQKGELQSGQEAIDFSLFGGVEYSHVAGRGLELHSHIVRYMGSHSDIDDMISSRVAGGLENILQLPLEK